MIPIVIHQFRHYINPNWIVH